MHVSLQPAGAPEGPGGGDGVKGIKTVSWQGTSAWARRDVKGVIKPTAVSAAPLAAKEDLAEVIAAEEAAEAAAAALAAKEELAEAMAAEEAAASKAAEAAAAAEATAKDEMANQI